MNQDEVSLNPEPEISIRVVKGECSLDTMRIQAQVMGHNMIALLDTGRSYNFISKQVMDKLKLPCEMSRLVNVKVASGTSMVSLGFCKEVPVKIQDLVFPMDFYVLDLNDYDFVIGVAWFKQLGPILWNLKELHVSFRWQGNEVRFKGMDSDLTAIISGKQLCRVLKKEASIALLELAERDPQLSENELSSSQRKTLDSLLEKYEGLFDIPTGLPPSRNCDHSILLKELTADWTYNDGVIFYKSRIYLHSQCTLIPAIMEEMHGISHEGFDKTRYRIRQVLYWKKMAATIKQFIRSCSTCQRHKTETVAPTGLLSPLPIPMRVWEDISMDFIEGLPKSEGKTVIYVVVDRLSNYAHFISLTRPYTTSQVAKQFFITFISCMDCRNLLCATGIQSLCHIFGKNCFVYKGLPLT